MSLQLLTRSLGEFVDGSDVAALTVGTAEAQCQAQVVALDGNGLVTALKQRSKPREEVLATK